MKIDIKAWIVVSAVVCTAASHDLPGQTHLDLRTQTKSADLSSVGATKPAQTGGVLPSACGVGEVFFLTSAPAGANLMVCAGPNQWSSSAAGGVTEAAIANSEYVAVSGTNTLTGSTATPYLSLAPGFMVRTLIANTNTGAVTFSPNSIAAAPVTTNNLTALSGGELAAGNLYVFQWDGMEWRITATGQGSLAAQANGTSAGTATALNLVSGTYVTQTVACTGGTCSYQPDVDTTKIPTNAAIQAGQLSVVITTSSSSTAYTGVMAANDPLAQYTANQQLVWNTGSIACAGGAMTLNIDSLGAIPLKQSDGITNPTPAQCGANAQLPLTYDAVNTVFRGPSSGVSNNSSSPVNTTLEPFGHLDNGYGGTAGLGTANNVWYAQFFVPSPGTVFTNIKGFMPSGGNVGNMAMGVYDYSCTLLEQSGTVTGAASQEAVAFPFSPLTLAPGTYFVGFSSDNSGAQFYSADSGYAGYLWNFSESAGTYRIFTGSNPSGTAGGFTTLPSTCGTRTALQTQGDRYTPWLTIQ